MSEKECEAHLNKQVKHIYAEIINTKVTMYIVHYRLAVRAMRFDLA